MRFIDLASDGGCSQKAGACELDDLLKSLSELTPNNDFRELSRNYSDAGLFVLNGVRTLSTVDVIFPMIDDAELFGKITANHVLNDIYASMGVVNFGLTILGLDSRLKNADSRVVQMLSAAAATFNQDSAVLVGGHTLANQNNLFLGFAAVGTSRLNESKTERMAMPGDAIVITKPLGTSIASLRWKIENSTLSDHEDVISGMLQSTKESSAIAFAHGAIHATDVSGFGFVNNLSILLKRIGFGADLVANAVPIYESVKEFLDFESLETRQFWKNKDFSNRFGVDSSSLNQSQQVAFFDSQTSGGLIIISPQDSVQKMIEKMNTVGVMAEKVGYLIEDSILNIRNQVY